MVDEAFHELQAQSELGVVPERTRWRGYQIVRVRTLRRLQEELATRRGGGGLAGPVAERRLEDATLRVAGTPDRVEVRADGVEIVDLKTGWRVDDQLAPAHRRQLLLYAYLWHATQGVWPARASVQRLDGERVSILVRRRLW